MTLAAVSPPGPDALAGNGGLEWSLAASKALTRYDLTDFEWRAIQPHLPNKPTFTRDKADRRR